MASSTRPLTPHRRDVLAGMAGAAATAPLASCASARSREHGRSLAVVPGEWRTYGGDNRASKYAPLDQIDATNAARLEVVWIWESPDAEIMAANPGLAPGEFQATPLMVGETLYLTTAFSQVVAVDAVTGETVWRFDPESWRAGPPTAKGFLHRGLAWWDDGAGGRLLVATGDARLLALDARTGQPVSSFGSSGSVDLSTDGLQRPADRQPPDLYSCTSPPLICRDVVVVGSQIRDRVGSIARMPPGDVRGYDVRSGAHLWTFHTVPKDGEFGSDTWEAGSAARTGNANVWAPMSADDDLGLIYLPGSCPSNNVFGGARPGDNLFGNALIALDARTGLRRWHFQTVRHDIWDYDLPCAPNLVDITVAGRARRAVAQVTKQGFCFVLDRVTGEPIWPIEDRDVPASPLAGERTAATQPHPTRPAPFESQGASIEDLIDVSPEIRSEAETLLSSYRHGPLFTPYGSQPTLIRPSWIGGANWGGAGVDPESGVLFVPSQSTVAALALDDAGRPVSAGEETSEIAGSARRVQGPRGLPLFKPPYSRITAIDLNTGDHLWMRPNGPGATDSPAFRPFNLGWIGSQQRAAPLVTRSLLFVGEGPHDRRFGQKVLRAYDKANGAVQAEIAVPDHPLGAPLTYMARGRQFVVFAAGYHTTPHRLIALAVGPAR
ncbi:PQQ-binding-like beta-propeller repeat protein [Brevundimonas sp. C11]|uniref:PQQ-binding-like beta-propeller repeat protein n=1 Tax=Brevundimonas aurifodinae TaxID=1508312 RepID=A0ABV1NMC5_9CAUL